MTIKVLTKNGGVNDLTHLESCIIFPVMKKFIGFLILFSVPGGIRTSALGEETKIFESHCKSLEGWDLLDIRRDGKLFVEEDGTVPKGHGPQVLRLEGDETLLLAKGARFRTGTIVVLWKDEDPEDLDADGVLVFYADYPEDITQAHNTKQRRAFYLLEQDADLGFQIKYSPPGTTAVPVVEKVDVGLVQGDWNRNGWIWQKVSVSEEGLRARFWSAALPEPDEWQIEIPDWKPIEGRIGVRVWTGKASLAYFAASEEEIAPRAPVFDLHVSKETWFTDQSPAVRLFLNPDQTLKDSVVLLESQGSGSGNPLARREMRKDWSAGHHEIEFGAEGMKFPLPSQPEEGMTTLIAKLFSPDGNEIETARRAIEFRSRDHYAHLFQDLKETAGLSLARTLSPLDRRYLEAKSALAMLENAKADLEESRIEEVDRTLEHVYDALNSKLSIPEFTCRSSISAESFVMGETYEALVNWERLPHSKVSGENLWAVLEITDDLGIETPVRMEIEVQTPGADASGPVTRFVFRIPEEFPSGRELPIERPAIREGFHQVWISLRKGKDGSFVWLDLANPDREGSFGRRHEIGRAYVTQNPVEIRELQVPDSRAKPDGQGWSATLQNHSDEPFLGVCALDIRTESRGSISTDVCEVEIPPDSEKSIRLNPAWKNLFGRFNASLEVLEGEKPITKAEERWSRENGFPFEVTIGRLNQVIHEGDGFRTKIVVEATPTADYQGNNLVVSVFRKGETLGTVTRRFQPGETQKIQVEAPPRIDRYNIEIRAGGEDSPRWRQDILAPIFENRKGELFLNGEPFIVKGVNVHGLIPQSPRRARLMMRLLKEIGFNMLRGDYPPIWEVKMGEEENLGWMVLAPFSVTTTDVLGERHGPHAFARMREITRRFIEAYEELSATWLWNCCNEVTGEIDDFLVSLYPIYKEMDPYDRPVVYANLSRQDRTLGQDVMAINYYYDLNVPIDFKQEEAVGSIAAGKEAGIPVIYTEFNCWFGPVYSRGAEAVSEFFDWGIARGMNGGFFYQLREDRDRHPGIVVNDDTLWTNPTLVAALRRAFDDAECEVVAGEGDKRFVVVKNRRAFTLRKVRYEIREGDQTVQAGVLDDFPPHQERRIELELEGGTAPHILRADLDFETHFGVRSHIENSLYIPREGGGS